MPSKPKTDPVESSPPAPDKPPRVSRRDTLHVAYTAPANGDGITDLIVFGVRPEALEHAIEQTPPWKVVTVAKGQSLVDAITAKEKS